MRQSDRFPASSPQVAARPRARRALLLAAVAAYWAPILARAQPGTLRRVGFVSPTPPDRRSEAFVQGLRDLGYVDGVNLVIAMRFAHGSPDRLSGLIEELLRSGVDVLVAGSTIGAKAAKQASTTVPIVFAGSSDPVAGGIVTNLARPEGNITGLSTAYGDGFAGKWLELLKMAAPGVERIAVLWSSSNASATRFVADLEAAARGTNTVVAAHRASNPSELEQALAQIGRSGASGLIVTPSPFAASQATTLVRFAARHRLPAIYFSDDFVDAGGLMSYGPSIADSYREAAAYVDRILKGAKPADLPVAQSTRVELTINLETARGLGLILPNALLLRADRLVGVAPR